LKTLFTVGPKQVGIEDDGSVSFIGGMTIDADGSPRAYGPRTAAALDDLANAGHDGNWWGIATDTGLPDGRPLVQGPHDPFPGYYISTTAYMVPGFERTDPRAYLDSEKVPFIVVPGRLVRAVQGVVLGCKARITDLRSAKIAWAVVGDIGPDNHLGEASMAAASALGIPNDPIKGGSSGPFLYELWPGVPAPGFLLQRS